MKVLGDHTGLRPVKGRTRARVPMTTSQLRLIIGNNHLSGAHLSLLPYHPERALSPAIHMERLQRAPGGLSTFFIDV